jgi:tRNA (mo5U34)-methyltransferase
MANNEGRRIGSGHAQQQRVDAIQWYHDIDFPNGVKARTKTPDAESHRALWDWMRAELDKVDFSGKTVLDIGCWDGYWSFTAVRLSLGGRRISGARSTG